MMGPNNDWRVTAPLMRETGAAQNPICRIRAVEDQPTPKDAQSKNAAQKGARADAVSAHLPRLLSAFEKARVSQKNASRWLADALSLLAALQKFGHLLTRLIARARRSAQQNLAGEDSPPEALLDAETVDEIRQQFQALIDQFPDAGELIFGLDKVDKMVGQLMDGSAPQSLQRAVGELAGFLDTQIAEFMARLVDWVLDDDAAGFQGEATKFQRLEEFIRALETLMQEVLDRWVLPGFYDFDGDEDDPA